MAVLDDLKQAIISGDRDEARVLAEQARGEGVPTRMIVVDGVAAAMEVVGRKFHDNEFFVPELLIAQRAMLEGAGFRVVDLGVDVSAYNFAAAAKEHSADIVAMSALLTTTMGAMRDTVAQLSSDGISAKAMIGGAPVTESYAEEIEARAYAPDAASAVERAKELLASR